MRLAKPRWEMIPFHRKVNQIMPDQSISICKIQQSKANASIFFLGFFKGFKHQSAVLNTACNFYHESFLLPSFNVSVQSHIRTHSFFHQREKNSSFYIQIDIGLMSSGRGNHLSFPEVLSKLVSKSLGLHTSPK